jgi:hypothetical protein
MVDDAEFHRPNGLDESAVAEILRDGCEELEQLVDRCRSGQSISNSIGVSCQ